MLPDWSARSVTLGSPCFEVRPGESGVSFGSGLLGAKGVVSEPLVYLLLTLGILVCFVVRDAVVDLQLVEEGDTLVQNLEVHLDD